MRHAALALVACTSNASTTPPAPEPSPKPAPAVEPSHPPAARKPEPVAPVAPAEPAVHTGRDPTALSGFRVPAHVELPEGFAVTHRDSIDGEGDAWLAEKADVSLVLAALDGAPRAADVKRGMHAKTFARDTTDASGFVLVGEVGVRRAVAVYRDAVGGMCTANVKPEHVDAVLAICASLAPDR